MQLSFAQPFTGISLRASGAPRAVAVRPRRNSLLVRAQTEEDDDFEARLAALKTAKGQTPIGQGKKKVASKEVKKKVGSSAGGCMCSARS